MEYSLYVYGGGEILCKVFNGVALLFKSENPYFTSVGTLTMGIGLLYIAARAIPQASLSLFFKSWFLPTFLLVALFYGPKASVHIIDKVDNNFQYNKVDNIPVGVAAVASLSTHFSTYLAETVETVFTTSDAQRFSKVGPLFGAKLIHAANTLTIKDPLMRENLKDFTRQCFAWPYVFSNLDPGKKAALETNDMLGFIESNPHPLLGIYWREPNGQASFVDCRSCAAKVRQVIPLEIETGLQSLASQLFSGGQNPEAATRRLQQYFGEAWQSLAKGTSNAANIIQQELMLNSYRSALLDKRDELGLGRYDSNLINLNAERGQAFQNSSFLIKAALSGTNVTILHTIFFAIALMYFTIMAPMTFLPGGISWVTTWVKVMVWLASWPVLFAVLNCLGYMFAGQATRSCQIGYGEGLNLMTQNGLADAAYTAYCWVMGLQYSVPFISWALISKASGHAFSQLASSLSQTGESFAGKAGSEIVDGNVSFDSQTLHHRSIANSQIAQQQLGSSFNYGSRFDDGKLATIHGVNGTVVAQEHQSNFGTNVTHNDAFSQMFAMQSRQAQSAANQQGLSLQRSVSRGSQELFSFATSVAENKGVNESFGNTESANLQKQMQNLVALSDKFAEDNQLNKQVAFDALVEASIGASGGVGKLFNAGINARGSFKAGGSDIENITKAQSSDIQKQFSDSLNQAVNYALDNKASIGKSFNTQSLDQAQAHFSHAETHADNMSAHLSESQSLSEMASRSRQMGTSSVSNANEEMLGRVAEQFGGDKVAAAQHLAYHPEVAQQVGSNLINASANRTLSNVESKSAVNEFHADNMREMGAASLNNPTLNQMRHDHNIATQEKDLDQTIDLKRTETQAEITKSSSEATAQKNLLDERRKVSQETYLQEKEGSLVGKTFDKADDNLSDFKLYKNLKSTAQDFIGTKKHGDK